MGQALVKTQPEHQRARISLLIAVAVAGVFALWGGWTRRWMSDDGLIVLRTVRNLLAGNGPVFNIGERVEANTSTLWQYLITAAAWLTGGRLEDIATVLALALTVAGAVIATYAAGRYWQVGLGAIPVIPLGVIIYFALPPARDFATSGLEWGLAVCWLAIWWWLLVSWSESRSAEERAVRDMPPVGYVLALWCGLSWLVRPEFALYGGVCGIMLIATAPRKTPGILLAALPLPGAYELFRMGYYGLITPHTAVAKSAADAQWAQGWGYLWNFVGYYWLYLPLVAAVALGVWCVRGEEGRRLAVVLLTTGCALAHILYVLRLGGDFMHGRMLLLPLFALLLPVMAVPLRRVSVAVVAAVVLWAGVVIVRANPSDDQRYQYEQGELGIVDERDFWTTALGRPAGDPPRYAEDFLAMPMMRTFPETLEEALETNAGQIAIALDDELEDAFRWYARPRMSEASDLQHLATTAYWVNLGMTSMNAPLEARVLDTVGLATPLAARMPRDPDGRVGHDKQLPEVWQVADTAVDVHALPDWIDPNEVEQAREAMRTGEIAELLATSREPLSWDRFWKNVRYSLGPGRTLQLESDPASYPAAGGLAAR